MSGFTFKFYLHKAKESLGKAPIYLRITVNRQKAEMTTGVVLLAKEWDSAKQRSHKNQIINENLTELENRIYQIVTSFNKSFQNYTANDIKEKLLNKTPIDQFFVSYFQNQIDRIIARNEVEKSTIKSYEKAKEYLLAFIESKFQKSDIKISLVDFKFISDFDLFLIQKGLQRNTITKHEKKIKSVLLTAQREKLISFNPYADFKLKSVNGKREFLTQEEIDEIIKNPLADNLSLIKVRDIFIFSVYTALRFTDAMNLKMEDIKVDADGNKYIMLYQLKTTEPVIIPILPRALEIIEKYQSAEREITKKVLPLISNQKLNSYLKTIADLCGITKPLTHHIARHTCATTVLLSNNVPMEVVSKWLGHNSLKTTQVYAKISAQQLMKVANQLNNK
jgi:integrase/recombinase XerD